MAQKADDIYQAVFCPGCGENLNPLEDLESEMYGEETARCGWCGGEHTYAGIAACRRNELVSDRIKFEAAAINLQRLVERLS